MPYLWLTMCGFCCFCFFFVVTRIKKKPGHCDWMFRYSWTTQYRKTKCLFVCHTTNFTDTLSISIVRIYRTLFAALLLAAYFYRVTIWNKKVRCRFCPQTTTTTTTNDNDGLSNSDFSNDIYGYLILFLFWACNKCFCMCVACVFAQQRHSILKNSTLTLRLFILWHRPERLQFFLFV